jgi:hypothetical protein
VFLLCFAFLFLVINTCAWALDPLVGYIIIILLSECFGIYFSSTFFESSFGFFKVGCMVFRSDDGDENDEGCYDTNEDTLDLRGVSFVSLLWGKKKERG